MTRESMIICPQKNNEGKDLSKLSELVTRKLVKAFGGCTQDEAIGSWIDPNTDTLYNERVWRFFSAYSPNAENDNILRSIGEMIGQLGEQFAVYIRYASGNVEILDTSKYAAKLAA